jgi:hypothetical protein
MEGELFEDAVVDVLAEGFYDWNSQGWMKMTVDGKRVMGCCGKVEGRAHQPWCVAVNGPEASETE